MALADPQELPRDPDEQSLLSARPESAEGGYDLDPDQLAKKLFAMSRAAVSHAETSGLGKRKGAMARSYRSYNNEHSEGSKYLHKNYSSRSKLHVPKTRSAVQKNMVAAAAALFSTDDVVQIGAEDDSDPAQLASAELNKALLNYRLDRTSHRSGIPWFRICMGMVLDCRVPGVCFTKQFWEYEERIEESEEALDPNDPNLDQGVVGMKGRPVRRTVIRDRPMIDPHPPENGIIDEAAPWYDVVQGGAFFIMKIPMHVGDVKAMMKPGRQRMGGGAWFKIEDKVMGAAVQDSHGAGVRSSRNQGTDRYSRTSSPAVNDFAIVWVHENFFRCEGKDYHFWTLGTKQLLSAPKETEEAYPALRGERPYVMGVGAIEPHNALPMSPVESWRPLQDQINDIVNLRLDTMKQSIAPIAMYRRGANVDLRAVRERGPDATIQVSDLENDLKFERASGPDRSAYEEVNQLNAQFDEQAGSFATSTVQASRAIGETARGMQLVNNAANSVQEFDLRVFIETAVEPVLRHLVWLEQYYETDETLLGLMAKKADVYQRFQVNEAVDDLLDRQITVKVDVGIGATDPMQKIQKLNAALEMGMKIAPAVQGQVKVKGEELFSEIFGAAGHKADRFFTFKSPEEAEQEAAQNPPPEVMEVKMKGELETKKLQLEEKTAQLDHELALAKNEVERERINLDKAKIALELKQVTEQMELQRTQTAVDVIGRAHDMQSSDRDAERQDRGEEQETKFRALDAAMQMPNPEEQTREQEMQQGESASLERALTAIGEGQQQIAEALGQMGEVLAMLVAQKQQANRMVRDGMGRDVPVETR